MTDAPDLVGFLEDRAMLPPRRGIQNVVGFVVEHPQAVIRGPAAAGGVNDENVSVPPQHLGPFADGHRVSFPGLIGRRDENAGTGNRGRVLHRRDIDVLLAGLAAGPAGPQKIFATGIDRQDRAVDRPALRIELAPADVLASRIGSLGLENPHAVVVVVPVIRGVIDVPFAVDEVQFRRPDVVRVQALRGRAPDANSGIMANRRNRTRTANEDLAAVAGFGIIVETAVKNHPRIGRMGWQNRINNFRFVCSLIFAMRTATTWRRFVGLSIPPPPKGFYPPGSDCFVVVCLTNQENPGMNNTVAFGPG